MPLYGGAIPGFFQGIDQAQQRALLMQQAQQAQQQQRQQQQGQAALANMLAQQPPPQQQPQTAQGPLPPPPGQQQPPPMQPPPQGGPQMPPPVGGQGMPPPSAGMGPPPRRMMGPPGDPSAQPTQGPQPLPPYTSPKPMQPAGQQGPAPGIQPPPQAQVGNPITAAVQSTLPNLHDMASKLKEQGVTGMPLYYALMAHKELLSQEGKQQLAELNLMLRKEQADNAGLRAQASMDQAATRGRGEDRLEGLRPDARAPLRQSQIDVNEARANRLDKMPISPGKGRVGKPQMFTGTDGRMYSRIMTSDGQIITRDASGKMVDDEVQSAGSAGQQIMRNTVKLDISEIDYALENMKQARPGQTASIFFLDGKDKGTLARWRDNKLTPDESQQYDVYANRVATAIAGMQSMGRGQVSDEKIRQAQKLVPAPGNTEPTIRTKFAAIQRIRDNANGILQGKSPDDLKGKPQPSDSDRAYAKAHPEVAGKFKEHFGVDP